MEKRQWSYARELSEVGKDHIVLKQWGVEKPLQVKVTRPLPPCPNGYIWQVSSQPATSSAHSLFLTKKLKQLAPMFTITGEPPYPILDHYTSVPGSILHPLFPFSAIIKPVKLLPLGRRLLKRWHRILTLCFLLLLFPQWMTELATEQEKTIQQ